MVCPPAKTRAIYSPSGTLIAVTSALKITTWIIAFAKIDTPL
jgi:hypothetical protein